MVSFKERIREQAQRMIDSESEDSGEDGDREEKEGSDKDEKSGGLMGSLRGSLSSIKEKVLKKIVKDDGRPSSHSSSEDVRDSAGSDGKKVKTKKKRGAVFCSEFAALFYNHLSFDFFKVRLVN
jgi:hypothetical protein